ncbi:MAG: divalent-cation tolerance protein CutA [Pseudomonadota bacterium]
MTIYLVTTTVANREDAEKLARHVVDAGLAACVHIDEIVSYYPWDGEMQRVNEVRLTLKTSVERYPNLEAAIAEHHPYDIPAIIAVPAAQTHKPYEDWVLSTIEAR